MESFKSLFGLAKYELRENNRAIHAVQILEELVKFKQTDGIIWFYYGAALQETQQTIEAYKAYQHSAILLEEDGKGRAYVRLGILEKKLGLFKKSEDFFKQASELLDNPAPSFWMLFGLACMAQEKYKEALLYFKKAYDLSKQSTDDIDQNLCDESCLNQGYIYRRQERYVEAIASFEEALKWDPNRETTKKELSTMEALGEALDISSKIKNRYYTDDQLEELYFALNNGAADNWNQLVMYEVLKEYLIIKPENGIAWNWYSRALRDLGRGNDAFQALDKVAENCSDNVKPKLLPTLNIDRALLCELFKTRKEAEKWYEIALKNAINENTVNWFRRGKNLAILGDYEKAFQCYEKALECPPKREKILTIFGEDIGNYPLEEVCCEMGVIARIWGKFGEARGYFKEALEVDPDNFKAKSALEGLTGIEKTLERCSQFAKQHK